MEGDIHSFHMSHKKFDLLQEVTKLQHQSTLKDPRPRMAPAALEEDLTPACVYLLFWPYPTLGMGGERVEGSNGGRGWLWLGRGSEGRERESMH